MHKAWCSIEEVPYCFPRSSIKFQGHTGQKNCQYWPELSFSRLKLQFEFTHGFEMMCKAWFRIEKMPYCFSCDQAALWMVQSVYLSVTPFSLCSCHRVIMKLSEVITIDKSDVRAKVHGQRSKVKVTEVKTQLNCFRTVTPVWIHIWWINDAQSLMVLRRRALLFFKVMRQISRSHAQKIVDFDPNWAFPDCNSSLKSPMAMKWCTKLEVA